MGTADLFTPQWAGLKWRVPSCVSLVISWRCPFQILVNHPASSLEKRNPCMPKSGFIKMWPWAPSELPGVHSQSVKNRGQCRVISEGTTVECERDSLTLKQLRYSKQVLRRGQRVKNKPNEPKPEVEPGDAWPSCGSLSMPLCPTKLTLTMV